MASEQVRFDILIEAKIAMATMKELLKDTQDNNIKMKAFSNTVLESSRAWGRSWQYALGIYKQLNAELSKAHKPTMFGNVGGQDLFAGTGKILQGMEDGGRIASKVAEDVKKVPKALNEIPPAVQKTSNAFGSMINVVKGAITAMLTLAALRAVTQFFTGAIKAAQDFRAQLLLLNFSEAILSQKGMDITRAELDKFVTDVETKFKYLSKLQAMTIVSETAGATQEFGISKEQLGDLTKAIAFIQLKNKMLGREDVDAAHIINAAMDARSNFFNGMGINITKSIVDQKAYNMGLAKWGEELTKDARFQAILALLVEQTSSKQEELNKQLEGTPLGNQMKFSKEWADTMLEVGTSLLAVKDNLIELWANINANQGTSNAIIAFFENLTGNTNDFINALDNANEVLTIFAATEDALNKKYGGKDKGGISLNQIVGFLTFNLWQAIIQGLATLTAEIVAWAATLWIEIASGTPFLEAWKSAGNSAVEAWTSGWDKAWKIWKGEAELFTPNTPAPVPNTQREAGFGGGHSVPSGGGETQEEINAEMQEKLDKFNQEILEAQLKLAQDMEDAAIDLGRKLYDITVEYEQKRADAYRNYQNRIDDINRDFDEKIEDINRKQQEDKAKERQDELEREREFQNKMQELKENFLMDLDDALHARDARQILRLIKQYNLDKLQAERKNALDEQSAKENARIRQKAFDEQRKQAEEERKQKIADAQQDLNDKLAQLALDEALEIQAANLKYQREIEDLTRHMQDRLEIIAANLAMEYATTAGWLAAIVAVYRQYYADVSAIYAAIQTMMSGAGISMGGTGGKLPEAGGIGGVDNPGMGGGFRFAKGGTLFANRPTNVTFGEGGLEMATFTPLDRRGQDTNKIFSSLGGGANGADGKISIELLLSPDLESRIVSNTLNKTADIVTRIRNSK